MDLSVMDMQFNMVFMELMMKMMDRLAEKIESAEAAGQQTGGGVYGSDPNVGGGVPGSSDPNVGGGFIAPPTGTIPDGNFAEMIRSAAAKYQVDAGLVSALIKAESGYNPSAVSYAGAQGLMQLMPGTAAGLGVSNPLDPEQNIDGGTRYLRQMMERYDGNVRYALAAYNAGPGAVDRYNGIPPYQETQTYVNRVMDYWKQIGSQD